MRREKLLPLLDFRLKKVFVHFLAKDMANFYGKKSLRHLREDNFMVNRFIEALGAARYKTYRIYTRPLT